MKNIILIFIILFQFIGCSRTVNAWNGHQPEEYYGVLGDDSLPQTLTDKNVTFSCKEMVYSSEGYTKKCYVKKDTAQNINNWGERILITTVTAGLETIENIVIVGFYTLLGIAEANGR